MSGFYILFDDGAIEGIDGQLVRQETRDISNGTPALDSELTRSRNPFDLGGMKWKDGALTEMTDKERQLKESWDAEQAAIERHNRIATMEVTPKSFWQAAYLLGITESQVDAMLDAIPDEMERALAKIEKEKASVFQRNHPMVISMAQTFGITEEQLDDLFEANQIGGLE